MQKLSSLKHYIRSQITRLKLQRNQFWDIIDHDAELLVNIEAANIALEWLKVVSSNLYSFLGSVCHVLRLR